MAKINLSDFINKQFGRLTVTNVYRNNKGYAIGEADCSCGKKWKGYLNNLRLGYTRSCGCLGKERAKNEKHKPEITKDTSNA